MVVFSRTGFLGVGDRPKWRPFRRRAWRLRLVSGIKYFKLQIIGFRQNASAILHGVFADRFPARKRQQHDFREIFPPLEAETRVWSSHPAARFNVIALKYRLLERASNHLRIFATAPARLHKCFSAMSARRITAGDGLWPLHTRRRWFYRES
jgi:hypothetical protein